jgi:hypothetical protein
MSKLLPLSNAFTVTVLPIVTPENRAEWEAYSVANDGWVDESTAIQATWDGYYGPIVYGGEKNREIHGDFDVIPANERYVREIEAWLPQPVNLCTHPPSRLVAASCYQSGRAFLFLQM